MTHALKSDKPVKSTPALKLVKTADLNRDEWLNVRKAGIGSSDAGAAVGLHPYKSPLELWREKTGRDNSLPKVDPNDESSPMYWGTLLEPIVAAHYTKRTGNKVRRINAVLQHPQHSWMLANIDREVMGALDVQILECKTAGCSFGVAGGCKPYARLNVRIGEEDELGSFIFRTTGSNSIRTLAARMRYFQALSGDHLSALPLELRLRGKSTTQSYGTPIYYVDLTVRVGSTLAQALRGESGDRRTASCGLRSGGVGPSSPGGLCGGRFRGIEGRGRRRRGGVLSGRQR